MTNETVLLNKNSVVAASLMAMTAAFDVERTYTGGRYAAAKHDPLTKKQNKSRSKNKAAKQARKKNRK